MKRREHLGRWRSPASEARFRALEDELWREAFPQAPEALDVETEAGTTRVYRWPGDGRPVVLMADRQPTGGYPKIATVISADLPALGRLCIGSKIRFESVTVAQAHALRREMLSFLEDLPNYIVPISPLSAPFAPRLFDYNLISGVVDARTGLANPEE